MRFKMSRISELSDFEKGYIVGMRENKIPYSEIANRLGRSESGVRKFYKFFFEMNEHSPKNHTGRLPLLSKQDKRSLFRNIRKKRDITLADLSECLNERRAIIKNTPRVSPRTIQRALHSEGFHSRKGKRKPLVNENNRKKRLSFCKEHRTWAREKFAEVVFSDESRFSLFGRDGSGNVWRQPEEKYDVDCLIPKVQNDGGSVMVWSCFTENKLGPLVILRENINTNVYIKTLEENLIPFLDDINLNGRVIFQQDNAPPHKSKQTMKWLEDHHIKVMIWPPNSPDLNPIENLWDELEKAVRKRPTKPKNLAQLELALSEEWNKLDPKVWKRWVLKMPKRIKEVLKLKGYPTKY